jgi:phage recombination protein Bet
MSNPQLQPAKSEREIEFTPFGSDSKIKLSVKMVQTFLATPTRLGHTCSERDAMKFIMLCQARALNPWEGDAYIVGYDSRDNGPQFSIITAHQAFLKRAEANDDFDGMLSGVMVRLEDGKLEEHEGDYVDDGETLVGGWAKVFRKSKKYATYRRLRLGNYYQESPLWKKNPAGQIVKCAEADALRSTFPTKLGGLYSQEEMPEPGTEAAFRAAKTVTPDPAAMAAAAITNSNGSHQPMPQFSMEPEKVPITHAQPSSDAPSRQTTPEASPQEKLKVFVEQGFDWATMDLWLDGTGNKPEGADWKSFSDIPDELAKRFLRAKDGLKKGLAGAKGAMSHE